jgi:hypothetical protein
MKYLPKSKFHSLWCFFSDTKSNVKDTKKDEAKQQRRPREDKTTARKGNNYVQTFGFLSEGIAHHQKKYESSKSTRENSDETISRPKIIKQEESISARKSDIESEQILANLIGVDDEGDSKATLHEDGTVPIKIKKCK